MAGMENYTALIDGYEEMTTEQKLEAIMGLDIPEKVDTSKMVSKELFDKKASELAEANKKLKSKMTEDEQKQIELAEAAAADKQEKDELRARIAELEKNNTLREYTIGFGNLGFDDKTAAETAELFESKDSVKFFANMKKFLEGFRKSVEKELMDKNPGVKGNGGGSSKEEDKAVELAKSLGGPTNAASKDYNDVMKRYTR